MKTARANSSMQSKDIASVFAVTAVILIVPLVAMQLSDEVKWTLADFIIMGTLLVGAGLLIVFAMRKINNIAYRSVVIAAPLLALLIIWAELAVGVLGSLFTGS